MSPRAARAASRALQLGAESHYLDARIYDDVYRRRTRDVRFYESIARELGGPILELGAGTGRVSLALARQGHEVVALDRMPSMLDRLRERLLREPIAVRRRVRVHEGDMASVRLRRRFPLVIAPFNVLMHLYTRPDLERALATVRAHLAPRGGRLVLDVLVPDLRALARPGARLDPATQVRTMTSLVRNRDDPSDLRQLPLAQRQMYPAELEALLHYNGLEMVARWGDFERGPLVARSESQVIVARARR